MLSVAMGCISWCIGPVSAPGCLPVRRGLVQHKTDDQQGPDTQVDHDVGRVEYIMPEWDLLNINKINNAAVDQSICNIAGAASDHKPKTDVLIAFEGRIDYQVGRDTQQQADTDQAKKPSGPLRQSKNAPEISQMREMNKPAQL